MRPLRFLSLASLVYLIIAPLAALADEETATKRTPRMLVELPIAMHTPDGADLNPHGNIILSIPNLSNGHLVESGVIEKPYPPVMAMIDAENDIHIWYTFRDEDMHADTGQIGPMDCAFGPDGHLYVADMQVLWDGSHKSRVLRINVESDKAVNMDVVVEGFIVANGMVWKNETLFVTESVLGTAGNPAEDGTKPSLVSGVYAFALEELRSGGVILDPYSNGSSDSHLVASFESGNTLGFGADGVTIASDGNLYTSVLEEGAIYKTTLDENDRAVETTLHAKGGPMVSSDGIMFNPSDNKIYVADLLANAVRIVDLDGNISTLHENGDTDGSHGALDQPVEILVRGNELIVVSMDIAWLIPAPVSLNTAMDAPYSISVFDLE